MASNITLTGRFGTDPESHAGEKGMRASFRFASTEYEQGEEHTDWYSVTVFGRLAERISRQGSKGKKATLWGRLRLRKYQTRNGEERIDARVTASHVEWTEPLGASSKPKSETKYGESSYYTPQPKNEGGDFSFDSGGDDGVPF
jgi:single-strand DNA-binding protein